MELAVVTLFTKHTYKFCGDIYLQQGGGPTVLSSSGSCADVRVTQWTRELLRILGRSGVTLELLFSYVDDIGAAMRALREEDMNNKETDTERTARVMKKVFNSIEGDLLT